jgi:predicted transcriptional regulator
MADPPNITAQPPRLIDGLPETASWDDLAYEVYVRQAIDAGLIEASEGRLVEHDEALSRIRSRIRRAS